jgi:hypothetical protein
MKIFIKEFNYNGMPSFTNNGFRIGIPNSETDDEFRQRLRNYIFEYVCRKTRRNEVGTYEEVRKLYNAVHPSQTLEQTTKLEFDLELITGDGTELRLTQKGHKHCKSLEDDKRSRS